MNDSQMKFITENMKEYLRENLTLDIEHNRGYYQEDTSYTISLKLEGEEISRVWFDS